jgi:hypothetical protein
MKVWVCKLYDWEEYETPIGRQSCGDSSFRRYRYEKIKNYYYEKRFKSEFEANEYGQEQMYLDSNVNYDIEELECKNKLAK